MHRRLRIPDLRKGSDSPLRTTRRPSHQRTSPSRRSSTPRIPRSGLSVTSQTQSPPSVSPSPALWPAPCRDAHAASAKRDILLYDTVRLEDPQPVGRHVQPVRALADRPVAERTQLHVASLEHVLETAAKIDR